MVQQVTSTFQTAQFVPV
jgi:hypothetical protein